MAVLDQLIGNTTTIDNFYNDLVEAVNILEEKGVIKNKYALGFDNYIQGKALNLASHFMLNWVKLLKWFPFTFSWGYRTIPEHYGAWLTWCYPKSFDSAICQIRDMVGQWLLVSRPLQVVPHLNVILLILRDSKKTFSQQNEGTF